jgi:uncharacterized protein (DUF4415 family)
MAGIPTSLEKKPMDSRKRTKAEERANTELCDILAGLEQVRVELEEEFRKRWYDHLPAEWEMMEVLAPVRRRKVRIHAAFDEDVAKFYRGLGHGYQARMNMVLRTYMLGVLSRHIRIRKNPDFAGRPL